MMISYLQFRCRFVIYEASYCVHWFRLAYMFMFLKRWVWNQYKIMEWAVALSFEFWVYLTHLIILNWSLKELRSHKYGKNLCLVSDLKICFQKEQRKAKGRVEERVSEEFWTWVLCLPFKIKDSYFPPVSIVYASIMIIT